ncbi:unnamed protein product, partial [marine sediment metagenome]
ADQISRLYEIESLLLAEAIHMGKSITMLFMIV